MEGGIEGKEFYSYIPLLNTRLSFQYRTGVIKYSYQKPVSPVYKKIDEVTYDVEISGLNLSDTLTKSKKDRLPVFNLQFRNNPKNDEIVGDFCMQVEDDNSEEPYMKVEATFNIKTNGFMSFKITSIKEKKLEYDFQKNKENDKPNFYNIEYVIFTIIKLIKHQDAHHPQKLDDVMFVFDTEENLELKILDRLINYTKKIERKIKTEINLEYKQNSLLKLCIAVEGFNAYIHAYYNILLATRIDKNASAIIEQINCRMQSLESILLSVNVFKQKINANINSLKTRSTNIHIAIVLFISLGILFSNFIKRDEFILFIEKNELFFSILFFTTAFCFLVEYNDFREWFYRRFTYLHQLKYANAYNRKYSNHELPNYKKRYKIIIRLAKFFYYYKKVFPYIITLYTLFSFIIFLSV
jgi:hypothetical protein